MPKQEEASHALFQLLQVVYSARRHREGEPLFDYNTSIIKTSKDNIAAMEAKATRREVVAKECKKCMIQTEWKKAQREEEKARKEATKVIWRIQAEQKRIEREREWEDKKAMKARKC